MKTAEIIYTGDLRTEAIHFKSGEKVITDAPPDNNGKGEAFSPTDLLSASLGCCMLTLMGIIAEKNNIDIKGTKASITKVMADKPRRVKEIIVEIDFPSVFYSAKERKLLENAARTCPVALSLHPDIKQTVNFSY